MKKWKRFYKLDDVYTFNSTYWAALIERGYLMYYDKDYRLYVFSLSDFKLIAQHRFDDFSETYYYFSTTFNKIYIEKDSTLYVTDFLLSDLTEVCTTSEKSIGFINDDFCIGRTSSRKPRILRNKLIRLSDCKVVYEWFDTWGIMYRLDDVYVFSDYINNILKRIDIKQNIELWKIELPSRALYYQPITKELFLVSQSFKTDHPVLKSYELWGINPETGEIKYKSQDDHESRYIFSKEKNKLYNIYGDIYRAVDPFTGRVLRKIKVAGLEKLWANSGRQSIDGDYIYFAISSRAMVGCFNVETEQLEELIEIEVDETEVDMSEPLETPYVHDGMMYVKDNSGVLHVLKKNQPA